MIKIKITITKAKDRHYSLTSARKPEVNSGMIPNKIKQNENLRSYNSSSK